MFAIGNFYCAQINATRMKKEERVTAQPERLQSDEEQAMLWNQMLGEYEDVASINQSSVLAQKNRLLNFQS